MLILLQKYVSQSEVFTLGYYYACFCAYRHVVATMSGH